MRRRGLQITGNSTVEQMNVADGLEWLQIYWIRGVSSKQLTNRNEVHDPPSNGWALAFAMPGEKRTTLFCPYSFTAFTVSNGSGEMRMAKEPKEFRQDFVVDMLRRKWDAFQSYGHRVDYNTAAMVFKRMGEQVPEEKMTGGEEDTRKKGGKAVGSKLLKPVKRKGKRGKFLEWFLEADGVRSVREAMAEFGMTRSNVLSYLYMIRKDHGIGYELVGDTVTVELPEGCETPFVDGQPAVRGEPKKVEPADEDDWLK